MQGASAQAWTQPFPYVSRLGTPGAQRWATVSSYAKTLHVLSRWQPGSGLTPDTDNFESLDAAQRAGEEWTNGARAAPTDGYQEDAAMLPTVLAVRQQAGRAAKHSHTAVFVRPKSPGTIWAFLSMKGDFLNMQTQGNDSVNVVAATYATADQLATALATYGPTTGAAMIARGVQMVEVIGALYTRDKTAAARWCFVCGYTASGDGGGGLYFRDDADNSTPDNRGSVIVAIDGARWKLIDKLNVCPEQFGAVGDWNGTSGTDDSQAFVYLAEHVVNNPGCVVTIRKQHYVKHGWTLPASNVSIVGVGKAEIHSDGALGEHTLHIQGQSNIRIEGVKLSQPRSLPRRNEFALSFAECSNVRVKQVHTDGSTAGIWFYHCSDVIVEGCYIDTPKADGIHFGQGSSYCKAIGNTVINPGDDAFSTTYYDNTTGRPHHIGYYSNTVSGGRWGFAYAVYSADHVEIIGNSGDEVALGLILVTEHVAVGGSASTDVIVSGNRGNGLCRVNAVPESYWFGSADLPLTSPLQMSGMVVSGNDVTATGNRLNDISSPVPGAAARTGISFDGGVRVDVLGNRVSKCGGTGISGGTRLLTECNVNNNTIDEVLGVGIRVQNAPLAVSFSICNNVVGYGATSGEPYMIWLQGAGGVLTVICNNTSAGGRGLRTDAGAGSSNLRVFNNN